MNINRIFILGIFIFLVIGSIALYNLFLIQDEYHAAVEEYEDIRQQVTSPASQSPSQEANRSGLAESKTALGEIPDLTGVNPDYAGWILIEDTKIDYPIVQGKDNDTYLSTTFKGTVNSSGTIFLDTYCKDGFDGPLAVLYGHNMKNGSMFGGLRNFTEKEYRETHSEILIGTPDKRRLVYQVADTRVTSGRDGVYFLPGKEQRSMEEYFSSLHLKEGAHILVLSTCTNRDTPEEDRLLVIAVRY